MGLMALSAILSIMLGSIIWLLIGNKFPLNEDGKWPIGNNIFLYALILATPIYLTIFFVF